MALRRDVEVPATKMVKVVRLGQVEGMGAAHGATGRVPLTLRFLADPAPATSDGPWDGFACVSADAAGDQMRPDFFHVRGDPVEIHGRVPVSLIIGDWLWIEA